MAFDVCSAIMFYMQSCNSEMDAATISISLEKMLLQQLSDLFVKLARAWMRVGEILMVWILRQVMDDKDVCGQIFTCMCLNMFVCTCMYICIIVYMRVCIHVCMRMCACVCVRECSCVRVHVYTCIYA